MAKELYNQLHPGDADAAGTIVDVEGQTLAAQGAPKTITVMKEVGVDVSQNTRHQVTKEMLPRYDKVIIMSEPENTPTWLEEWPKAERWDIQDTRDTDLDGTRAIRNELSKRIAKL